MQLRLDKYLADMGIGTRSVIKEYIKKKRITIGDVFASNPATKIDTDKDKVYFDGNLVAYVEYEYYIINKPAGVISATEDPNQSTVLDLINSSRKDLFPVGRLDKDTEGLLVITNDGMLAHNLLSPKKHVDKKYYLQVEGIIKPDFVQAIADGLVVDEELTAKPGVLEIINEHEAYLTISEGKFHQVKRMMEALGCTVTYLKRLSMGGLTLPSDLGCGEYRALTETELEILRGNDVK